MVSGIFAFLLGVAVFYKGKRKPVNISFALFAFFSAVWSASLYFYVNPPFFSSYNWIKIVYSLVFFMIGSSFYFSFVFPTGDQKKAIIPILLYSVISVPFVYLLFFTDLWVKEVVVQESGPLTSTGSAYLYWGIFNLTIGIWLLANLYSKYRKSGGLTKLQIRYVFLGIFIMAAGTLTVDVLLPVLINESRFFWASSLFFLPFLGFSGYAIVKHRLMDIRLVIARTVSYSLLSLIIAVFYAAGIFVVGHWFFPTTLNGNQLIISVFFALIVAYTFQPLRYFLEKATDKVFFQENYDPEKLLEEISRILATTLELRTLVTGVLRKLLSTLHLDFGAVLLIKKGVFDKAIGQGIDSKEIELSLKQAKLLASRKETTIIFDELEEGRLKKLMRQKNFGAAVKLNVKGKIVGILVLGQKLSGDIYTNNDIKVLEIFGPQLAVAIQNAQRYEEIKRFSEKLKLEVSGATGDLRKANEELKKLDRLKDEFVSMAAHELRAPMTAVKGYLSMVAEGDAGRIPQKAQGYLVDANAINERLIRLVNNMLNVSRIEEGRLLYQMETVNLIKVAQETFYSSRFEAERKGLKFSLNIPDGLKDEVYVDPDRIREVVGNLASNAVKFTVEGSIDINLFQPKRDTVRLEIVDTGPGISAEEQKKLFRKFYRVEATGGKTMGTGLGLYVSKLLVDEFKGKIGIESEFGKGSTFWFELPLTRKKKSSSS